MHEPEDEEDDSDLGAERFEDTGGAFHHVVQFQVEGHETEIHQIETDEEQMIHAVGEFFVFFETAE